MVSGWAIGTKIEAYQLNFLVILHGHMTISKFYIHEISDIMITARSSNMSYTVATCHHHNLLRLLRNSNGMVSVLTGIAAEERETEAEIKCDENE